MEVVASLSQGRTAAAQCGLFTYKSVPVIFEPLCKMYNDDKPYIKLNTNLLHSVFYSAVTAPTSFGLSFWPYSGSSWFYSMCPAHVSTHLEAVYIHD